MKGQCSVSTTTGYMEWNFMGQTSSADLLFYYNNAMFLPPYAGRQTLVLGCLSPHTQWARSDLTF